MADDDLISELGDGDANAALAIQIVGAAPFPMVLTDPHQEDNPIIFVNRAFQRATGYAPKEAIGRNCRFLQGKDTDRKSVARIREAIEKGDEITVDILNYTQDGVPFWNRLLIAPLGDEDGKPQYFFGVQKVLGGDPAADVKEEADSMLKEIQHRVKNHLMMVVGLIRMQSREEASADSFDKLAHRVESLQLLYEELNASGGENRDAVALGGYLSRIVNSVAGLGDNHNIFVEFDVDSFTVPLEVAVRSGLIVSEAMTNAVQHAFEGRDKGTVRLSVHENGNDVSVKLSDDGVGMPEDAEWPSTTSMGGRLIQHLAEFMDATLEMKSDANGSVVSLEIPASTRGL